MKSVTIARNYAEALFAAGDEFGGVLDAVSGAIQADERIAITLDSPRVSSTHDIAISDRHNYRAPISQRKGDGCLLILIN